MREIKLTVDGKEVKLTDEQIEMLGLKEKVKPFERKKDETYYFMRGHGEIGCFFDKFEDIDNMYYLTGNRCTDKSLMTKIAKETVLTNLLRRFSIENGWSDNLWDKESKKWFIVYDHANCKWMISYGFYCEDIGVIHFVSEEIAKRALNEIVLPFNRGELEVCKIWEE